MPSGITQALDFLIPDNLSPEQALAVIEFIDDPRARICMHYGPSLHDLLRELRSVPDDTHLGDRGDPF
ncbi:hypothetical protein CA602_28930 [Paraburkholderia hospita]|nr:hypothetical protein CA602_28930 [Paraburkholderia hospita]